MAEDDNMPIVSEEEFAAWLDGTLDGDETVRFEELVLSDTEMQEIIDANDQVEEDYEYLIEQGYDLPEEMTGDFDIPVQDNSFGFYDDPVDEDFLDSDDNEELIDEEEPLDDGDLMF